MVRLSHRRASTAILAALDGNATGGPWNPRERRAHVGRHRPRRADRGRRDAWERIGRAHLHARRRRRRRRDPVRRVLLHGRRLAGSRQRSDRSDHGLGPHQRQHVHLHRHRDEHHRHEPGLRFRRTPSSPRLRPNTPTIGAATRGNGSASVAFTANFNGGSAVTHFDASCTDGITSFPGNNTASPISVLGLTNGTSYTCTVTATNVARHQRRVVGVECGRAHDAAGRAGDRHRNRREQLRFGHVHRAGERRWQLDPALRRDLHVVERWS